MTLSYLRCMQQPREIPVSVRTRMGCFLGATIRTLTFLMAFGVASTGSEAQMITPGQFSVSPSGAATYHTPIRIPPGVAGIQPDLALNYSSQSGNGHLGIG